MIPTLALSALLLAAPDAGLEYSHCPEAPVMSMVDGGYVLTDARASRLACIIATCESERTALRKEPEILSPPLAMVLTSLGLGIGLAVGYVIWKR